MCVCVFGVHFLGAWQSNWLLFQLVHLRQLPTIFF